MSLDQDGNREARLVPRSGWDREELLSLDQDGIGEIDLTSMVLGCPNKQKLFFRDRDAHEPTTDTADSQHINTDATVWICNIPHRGIRVRGLYIKSEIFGNIPTSIKLNIEY